jgi:predicted aspartyl protease
MTWQHCFTVSTGVDLSAQTTRCALGLSRDWEPCARLLRRPGLTPLALLSEGGDSVLFVATMSWLGAGALMAGSAFFGLRDTRRRWVRQSAALLLAVVVVVAGWVAVPVRAVAASATVPGAFVSVQPLRLLDSRVGNGYSGGVSAGGLIELQVTGRGGVPDAGVAAVVLNTTVTDTGAPGYLTIYPSDSAMPLASNLNFVGGQTVANLVTVKVSADGKVNLFNGSSQAVNMVADVAGYFLAGTPTDPGGFVSLAPQRLLDSRVGNGYSGAVPAGWTIGLQIAGRGGVPATGVAAVVLNTTVTDTGAPGYITVYPSGATMPLASNLNFVGGQTVPNLVTVKLGADGKVNLFNGSSQAVNLVADVAGYYLAGTPSVDGALVSVQPSRLLDSRTGNGFSGAVPASGTVALQVTGRGGVPAVSGVAAVVLNTTVTDTGAPGYLTVYPSATTMPLASNLNFVGGQTVANLVTVKLGIGGRVNIYNGSSRSVDLVADVAGYYVVALPGPAPVIGSVSPATGATQGGDVVTITGTNLADVTSVTFDGVAGSMVTPVSDTQMTVTTPNHVWGAVDVTVTTPRGTTNRTGSFTYIVPATNPAAQQLTHDFAVPTVTASRTTLGSITVRASGTMDGYSRSLFPTWLDATAWGWPPIPNSYCDVRQAALYREGTNVVYSSTCAIQSGSWLDPYTATTLYAPSDVDIDHIVPLAEAWRSGAAGWTDYQRRQYANNRLVVLAVDDRTNAAKGDKTPDLWKPPNQAAHCLYAKRWIAIKSTFGLSVNTSEKTALNQMLDTCQN